MADYNRFISYIYSYENSRKTINTGFTKVENRNGQIATVLLLRIYMETGQEFKGIYVCAEESEYRNINR